MGESLLSNIWGGLKNVVQHPLMSLEFGAGAIAAAVAHPIDTIKSIGKYDENTGTSKFTTDVLIPFSQESTLRREAEIITTGAATIGAVTGVGSLAGSIASKGIASTLTSAAGTVGSIIINNPKSAAVAAIAAPFVAGAISASPETFGTIFNVGENVERGEQVGQLIKNHPWIAALSTGVLIGSAGLLGEGLYNAFSSSGTEKPIGINQGIDVGGGTKFFYDEQGNPTLNNPAFIEQSPQTSSTTLPVDSGAAASMPESQAGIPVLNKDKGSKKAYSKRKAITPVRITNRVNVENKNYIKVRNN